MRVLTPLQMYECDKKATSDYNILPKTLMESAGFGCAKFIKDNFPKGKVAVVCGSGNNGGDGFVIARKLSLFGFTPTLVFVGNTEKFSDITRINFEKCNNLPIKTNILNFYDFDMIVDAIFGIGFKGVINSKLSKVIQQINNAPLDVVSIDIPSGLNGLNGKTNMCVKANYTLVLAAYKYGHFMGQGKSFCGKLILIDIGIPSKVFEKFNATLATGESIVFPKRFPTAHKGNYGKLAIVAGSEKYSGAAILCCLAALNCGVGLAYLYHPKGMEHIFGASLIEPIKVAIDDNPKHLPKDIFEKDTLIIGCGFGKDRKELFETIVSKWKKPMVIDADGINILAHNEDILESLKRKEVLLTPHIGEFAKIVSVDVLSLLDDPILYIKKFCKKFEISVLLKNSTSVLCYKGKLTFITKGNDGLATGGSGDVLAGIIGSFLAQGMNMEQATISAAYTLGETAERLEKKFFTNAITPSRVIKNLFKK